MAGDPSGELARNLRRELVKLSDKWNALIEKSDKLAAKFEQNAIVRCFKAVGSLYLTTSCAETEAIDCEPRRSLHRSVSSRKSHFNLEWST